MHAKISEPSAARRVTMAEQALLAARDTLKEKLQQLERGDREHQLVVEARQQAELERKQLLSDGLNGLLQQKRATAKALQQGTLGWSDPDEMQTLIQKARRLGLEASAIDAAEAVLQIRREKVVDAAKRYRMDGDIREAEATRRARAEILGDELISLMEEMARPSAEPVDVRLTALYGTTRAARREGVEHQLISKAQDALRQWATAALEDALSVPISFDSLRLVSIVKLCKDADLRVQNNLTDRQIGSLLQQAQQKLDSQQSARIRLAIERLNHVLIAGSTATTSERNEYSLLEEAVGFVDDALGTSGASEGSDGQRAEQENATKLKATAISRLQVRQEEVDAVEAERQKSLEASWKTKRQQLELNISAARTAVEANEERRRLAEEAVRLFQNFESTEQMRRTAVARQVAEQQANEREQEKLQQVHERELEDALQEVKRLKWSIKIQQDGTAATVKKAKEDAHKVKDKAEDESRQAKKGELAAKKELERVRERLQNENDKQHRSYKEIDDRQQKRIKELEAQLKEEQKQTQLARDYAEQIKADQARIVGEWQHAEKEAMTLANKNLSMAEKNADVAKQALDAQKKAEEEMREAQKETKELREDIDSREQKLKDINTAQLDTVKQEKLNSQMFKEEADRLRSIEEKMSDELAQEKAHVEEARTKLEEMREELEKNRNDMREGNEKNAKLLRERDEQIKEEQAMTAASKEECLKVRADLADANEGRRKAKVEAKKMRVEHTEGTEARMTADREAKEATDAANKANAAMEDMAEKLKKAEAEVRSISNELTARHNKVLEQLDTEYEKKLAQKERQLEYVEESLERAEAINKKKMDKSAGARNRLDEDLRKAHERIKESQLETEAKAKEVEQLQVKMKMDATRQQNLKRSQIEEQERVVKKANEEAAKAMEQADKYKALLNEAIEAKRKAQDELTREVMNARRAEQAGAPRFASPPPQGGVMPSPGFAPAMPMDDANLERLASMIAANLQSLSPEGSPLRSRMMSSTENPTQATRQEQPHDGKQETRTPPPSAPQKRDLFGAGSPAGAPSSEVPGSAAGRLKPIGAALPVEKRAVEKTAPKEAPTLGPKAMAAASKEGGGPMSSLRGGKSITSSRESSMRESVSDKGVASSSAPAEGSTSQSVASDSDRSTTANGMPRSIPRPSSSPASSQRSNKKAVAGKARALNLTVVKNDATSTPPKGASSATSTASGSSSRDGAKAPASSSSRSSSAGSDRRGTSAAAGGAAGSTSVPPKRGSTLGTLREEDEPGLFAKMKLW